MKNREQVFEGWQYEAQMEELAHLVGAITQHLGAIKGKRILDVGCGYEYDETLQRPDNLRARFLGWTGADLTGIDVQGHTGFVDSYNHIQADFLLQGLREILGEDKRFDVVIVGGIKGSIGRGMYGDAITRDRTMAYRNLIRQIYELLDNKGLLFAEAAEGMLKQTYGQGVIDRARKSIERGLRNGNLRSSGLDGELDVLVTLNKIDGRITMRDCGFTRVDRVHNSNFYGGWDMMLFRKILRR